MHWVTKNGRVPESDGHLDCGLRQTTGFMGVTPLTTPNDKSISYYESKDSLVYLINDHHHYDYHANYNRRHHYTYYGPHYYMTNALMMSNASSLTSKVV